MDGGSPWTMALDMLWKSAAFYGLLLLLLRIMGKREVTSFTPLDLVVSIMLADAAIISIEDDRIPVYVGAVPVLVLAGLQVGLSWINLKSRVIRRWIEGRPAVLIRGGVIDEKELARQRMNLDELLSQLRLQNVPRVRDVEFAVLEPSGQLSVVPAAASRPPTAEDLNFQPTPQKLPMAVVVDGSVNRDGLRDVGGDEAWLGRALEKAGVRQKDVLLAMFDPVGKLFVQRKPKGGRTDPPEVVNVAPPAGGGSSGTDSSAGGGSSGADSSGDGGSSGAHSSADGGSSGADSSGDRDRRSGSGRNTGRGRSSGRQGRRPRPGGTG